MATKNIKIVLGGNHNQFEDWTEECTGEYIAKQEMKFWHVSYCGEVEEFVAGEICVYSYQMIEDMKESAQENENTIIPSTENTMGGIYCDFIYEVTVPAGTVIKKYDWNERRFNITPKFSIELIGKRESCKVHIAGRGEVNVEKYSFF